jgi:hypothetical protein
MRSFRHLSKAEISDIVASHYGGESQASLARRLNVDHSTIHYHLRQYERAYPEEGGVYALIKVETRKVCIHPSARCTICGEMSDMLMRGEREEIRKLTVALEEANSRLRVAGLFVE